MIVRVINGRPRKAEGNPIHPVNLGKLCAQGQAVLQELYDPDRLRNAVRQTGGRGSARFSPIYWEDALKQVVEALQQAGTGVAFLGGSTPTHLRLLVSRFLQAIGAQPPVFYRIGDELEGEQALRQAHQQLFGAFALPYFDIAHADVLYSFGANFLENWLSPMILSREYSRMRRGQLGRRGYIVQFEPRFSATTASADRWVPVNPGTEGLVALAIGKIIVDQKLARRTGFEPQYAGVDVGAIAETSGVSAEELDHLARIFAAGPNQIAIPGNGLAAFPNRIEAFAAVQMLNSTMNRFGQAGGLFFPPEMDVPEVRPLLNSTFGAVQDLIKRMAAGEIRVLFIHGTNPIFELPPGTGLLPALSSVPLVVSFSSTIDETAVQADLILPDHTNLESWGFQTVEYTDRRVVSGFQPVMRAMYDTRATGDVILALAQNLGGHVAQALPWRNEVEYLRQTVGRLNPGNVNADEWWALWRQQGGWWADKPELRTPMPTATLSQPLSAWQPTFEGAEDQYPLRLLIYPSVVLRDGRGANKAWLQETPEPMTTMTWQTAVEIGPETAKRLDLRDNDVVQVVSPSGQIEAIVYVYPGLPEGIVAIMVGRGHSQYGRWARHKGSNPLTLLPASVSPGSPILNWGTTRVQLIKTGRKLQLARIEAPEGVEYARQMGLRPPSPSIF